jgi:serine phosphatase RsbU (regulator of sigma subunit)
MLSGKGGPKRWQQYYRSVPFSRLWGLYAAVFCLFAIVGFFDDMLDLGRTPYLLVILSAIFSGFIALMYLHVATRMRPLYFAVIALVQVPASLGFSAFASFLTSRFHLQPASTASGIRFAGVATMLLVIISYTFFIGFLSGEGRESIRLRNELELAHGIQQTLVPPFHLRTEHFEIYGRSDPSDKVGGDLVDAVLLDDGSAIVYIADIAGHGLQAGILMGMLKTAARTALLGAPTAEPCTTLPVLMEQLNRVLPSVKEPQMYATFAGLRLGPDGNVFYALAAHPPILHYKTSLDSQRAQYLSAEQFPLGLLPVGQFSAETAHLYSGDLLVAITDGILEASNATGEEFGLDRLQRVIASHASKGLPALADAILSAVRAFGRQIDDQTLLLVRKL